MGGVFDLCAIDAGQTDLRFAVLSAGRELLTGRTGRGITNILLEGSASGLRRNLAEVRRQVRQALGASRFRVVAVGATGIAEQRREQRAMQQVLAAAFPGARLVLEGDFVAAHAANFAGRPGIILHAGTGDFAYGVDRDGQAARAGGWGYLLGDEGAGFGLGLAGIRAAVRALEDSGPETILSKELLDFFCLRGLAELKIVVYNRDFRRKRIADFAPRVIRHARAGDPVCVRLFEEAAGKMAGLVQPILTGLCFGAAGAGGADRRADRSADRSAEPADLALTGALFLKNPAFYEATRRIIVSRYGARLRRVRRGLKSPLQGVLWLGRRALKSAS